MESFIGQKLGQYEIQQLINKGGMGAVYRAFQPSLGRAVAIKILPPHPSLDENVIRRFEREAKTIGTLQHPHILPLYDYGRQDNILYIVMAYADGGSLADLMSEGMLPLELAERLVREIASALDYAHRRGIVHRDIKPGNILLDSEGHALLADFGIVKSAAESSNLTGTAIIGTPAYMSPEQGKGDVIDGRSDVYSLGVMAFEMLTGKQPFTGETPMKVLLKHISDPIPMILDFNQQLPVAVHRVMRRVLSKEATQRYGTGGEFAAALGKALQINDSQENAATVDFSEELEETMEFGADEITRANPTIKHMGMTPRAVDPPSQGETRTNTTTVLIRERINPFAIMAGFGFVALAIVVVAVLAISQLNNPPATPTPQAVVANTTDRPNFGEVSFTTSQKHGDTLVLTVRDLPGGARYAAWLRHMDGELLYVGEIIRDAFGTGTLTYIDPEGSMLPAHYNAMLITSETSLDTTPAPGTGTLIYEGRVPSDVSKSLNEIFVASSLGIDGKSLIESALLEANTARQHAGLTSGALDSGNITAMKIHAEHTVNILTGGAADLDGDGSGQNPGRRMGMYRFVNRIEALVQSAAQAPDANRQVQSNAEFLRVCLVNARTRADGVQELEKQLLSSDIIGDEARAAAVESTELMTALIEGIDANENGSIEPFEGECGLDQIAEYGILFGNIALYQPQGE